MRLIVRHRAALVQGACVLGLVVLAQTIGYAQDPFSNTMRRIEDSAVIQWAPSLSIIGFVIAGVGYMFSSHYGSSKLTDVIIGAGVAMFAPALVLWLYR